MPVDEGAVDALQRVSAWILGDGRASPSLGDFLGGLVERLRAEGVPIARAAVGAITLHPQFAAMRSVWTEEGGVHRAVQTHAERTGVPTGATPLGQLIVGAPVFRARLLDPDGTHGFRDLDDLKSRGFTDWIGHQVTFSGRPVGGLTFATRAAAGFSDAQLALVASVRAAAAVVIEAYLQRGVMGTVLRTYLGADAGERVLGGHIRRGDVTSFRSAIWFSDLRDFTVWSARLDAHALVATLNELMDPLVSAVQAEGGQVLKFMGDGLLAVFPAGDDEGAACRRALAAARAARASVDAVNARRVSAGSAAIDFGLGMHLGDAMYGNVGGEDRLDFTVVGPAVNRASRIEGQCKALGRWLLVSGEFAAACGTDLASLGTHPLKGIAEPVEVFGLPG